MFSSQPEFILVRDFLIAWRECSVEMVQLRAEAESKMRQMRRMMNSNIQAQSRKLTIAVTFRKWQEYRGVRRKEKEEERKQRKLAAVRLAQAKRKPTQTMLRRRASVIAGRKSSLTDTEKMKRGSFLVAQVKLAEYHRKMFEQMKELEKERRNFREENAARERAHEELRRRQMKALSVTRGVVEAWGENGRAWAMENIKKRTQNTASGHILDTVFQNLKNEVDKRLSRKRGGGRDQNVISVEVLKGRRDFEDTVRSKITARFL